MDARKRIKRRMMTRRRQKKKQKSSLSLPSSILTRSFTACGRVLTEHLSVVR